MRTSFDHTFGNSQAPIELIEYGDFDCPDCAEAAPIMKELKYALREKIVFVFRHMPLDKLYPIHPNATYAAEAAEAADAQGKFWEMHDALFEAHGNLNDESIEEIAESIGLDMEQFHQDLADGVPAATVEKHFEQGKELGVTATPTFFLNGEKVEDSRNYKSLVERIQELAA
jgi:protein-disulfide isomerase